MSTENDELQQREATLGTAQENSVGIFREGFHDVTGTYPRSRYFFGPGINEAARGIRRNELYVGGSNQKMDLGLKKMPNSQYPLNQVDESKAGHVIEIDDTPAGERILIRHRTGAGVEMRADGTILVTTRNNHVTIVQGDSKMIVEGDAEIQHNGNLNLDVSGDYTLKVQGDMNVEVAGDITETVVGNRRKKVYGNNNLNVIGNASQTTKGVMTNTTLNGRNEIVKGNYAVTVDGSQSYASSSDLKMSAETRATMSSPDINIAAQSISVFGDTGTIGGENVVMYNYNMYTGHSITATDTITTNTAYTQRVNATSMHATTFHGTLDGKASFAAAADQAGSAPLGPGSGGGSQTIETHAAQAVDPKATALPTEGILDAFLTKSDKGVKIVKVDQGAGLADEVDQSTNNDGYGKKTLTTSQVRSKLRDAAAGASKAFIATAVGTGAISDESSNTTPPSVSRVRSKKPTDTIGSVPIGQQNPTQATTKFKPNPTVKQMLPDPVFNTNFNTNILPSTKLARGITVSKFLGGRGDPITLRHIKFKDRRPIARQLYLQAEALKSIDDNEGKFKDYRMVVVEGLYRPEDGEVLTPGSLNDLASKGRAVVYELVNAQGVSDVQKTFDLAVYLKDNLYYDKLILDYDTLNPDKSLNAQIIIVMPEIDSKYTGVYSMKIETSFNNQIQSDKEFVEIEK